MNKLKTASGIIMVAFIICVLAVVVYLGSWWLYRDTTNREAQVQQQTYGRQNALVESILDDIKEAENPAIPPAQRKAIVDQICDNAAKLSGQWWNALPYNTQKFLNKECMQ